MEKLEQLYEGKAKRVFRTDDPDLYIVDYKDDATAFNGQKKGTIVGKGVINNQMTNRLMMRMENAGIPTHFVKELSERETLVKKSPSSRWRSSSATSPQVPLPSVLAWRRGSSSMPPPLSFPIKMTSWGIL